MKRALAATLSLVLALAGCADSEETIDPSVTESPATATPTDPEGAEATEPTGDPERTGAPEDTGDDGSDAEMIEQTLIAWDLEGGCEHMTDNLLELQTFLTDREKACAAWEELFVDKAYGPEDIVISDVVVKGDKATAEFGSEIAPDFTVTYSLVKVDGAWLIDDFDL